MKNTESLPQVHRNARGYGFYPASDLPSDVAENLLSHDDLVIYEHYYLGAFDWYVHCFDPETGIAFGYTYNGLHPEFSEWGAIFLPQIEEICSPFTAQRETVWQPRQFKDIDGPWTSDA